MNPEDPAFPWSGGEMPISHGISVRLYLAGQSLTGLLAAHSGSTPLPAHADAAEQALEFADALIALDAQKEAK